MPADPASIAAGAQTSRKVCHPISQHNPPITTTSAASVASTLLRMRGR
jgi:hypothetical protein